MSILAPKLAYDLLSQNVELSIFEHKSVRKWTLCFYATPDYQHVKSLARLLHVHE
jgi:hypothetical protein